LNGSGRKASENDLRSNLTKGGGVKVENTSVKKGSSRLQDAKNVEGGGKRGDLEIQKTQSSKL